MEKIEESPLGWEINLLYLFINSTVILAEDINLILTTMYKAGLDKKKRHAIIRYKDCMKEAERYLEEFGADRDAFEAVKGHSGMYSNTIASSKELIRMAMLHVDRAHCDGGSYRAFKALRNLPSNNIFPDAWIDRFQMKYEVVPEVGDRVLTTNHGQGVLLLHVGGKNWNVRLADNKEIILNEKQFKLL